MIKEEVERIKELGGEEECWEMFFVDIIVLL